MKKQIKAAVIALGAVALFAKPANSPAQYETPGDEEQRHYAWLADRLQEAYRIKPGMSKADLLKVFTEDGGLMSLWPQRYVLRSCNLIKVDVEFDVPRSGTASTDLPPDTELKIRSISKPYLEPMFMD
jgi:hypothetical protein